MLFLDIDDSDVRVPDRIDALRTRAEGVPIVVLSSDAEVESVVSSIRAGAFDYLTKPVESERFLTSIEQAAPTIPKWRAARRRKRI